MNQLSIRTLITLIFLHSCLDVQAALSVGMLRDISAGVGASSPESFCVVGEVTFFVAADPVHGRELWKTDGTAAGTQLVKDTYPGPESSEIQHMVAFNGKLLFAARDATLGHELWTSDGTEAGTVLVKDIQVGSFGSNIYQICVLGQIALLRANDGIVGDQLWRTDGTSAGTTRVTAFESPYGLPTVWQVVGNTAYFSVSIGASASSVLWRTDGTANGTMMVKELQQTLGVGSNFEHSTSMDGIFYFAGTGDSRGQELWRSDGTTEGTFMVKDINDDASAGGPFYVPSSNPRDLVVLNRVLYFRASHPLYGAELWRSDGTSGGTYLVRDIRPGSASSSPAELTVVGNHLYFQCNDGINGVELWKSDGTASGTVLVEDIESGSGNSLPGNFTNVSGRLFFSAYQAATGVEFWQSDGQPGGTTLVRDIFPGVQTSSPTQFHASGRRLFFSANNGSSGLEPWMLTMNAPTVEPVAAAPSYTQAVVNGMVLPRGLPTAVTIEYGTSPSLGMSQAVSLPQASGTQPQPFVAVLAGLDQGRTYYYRVTATNEDGSDQKEGVFTTLRTGQPDPVFSQDGLAITAFPTGGTPRSAVGRDVVVQPDGKVVVAGYAGNGSNNDMVAARYLADGSLDAGFGSAGQMRIEFGAEDACFSVALQADGKIVLGGRTNLGGNYDFALARLNADGSLDSSFDGDGKLITPWLSGQDEVRRVLIQPDGKIVAVGATRASSNNLDFALARYNTNGSLDTSFGSGGKINHPVGALDDFAYAAALQPNGAIVVGGTHIYQNGMVSALGFAVIRCQANGGLDTSFGSGGKVTNSLTGGDDIVFDIAIQPDGKIVAVGRYFTGVDHDYGIVRLLPNGTLDATFDSDGRRTVGFGSGADSAESVEVQPDGKLVISGHYTNGSRKSMGVLRLNSNGGYDQTYGPDGIVTSNPGPTDDRLYGAALDENGNLVAAGFTTNSGGTTDVAVLRLLAASGPGLLNMSASVAPAGSGLLVIGNVQPAGTETMLTVEHGVTSALGSTVELGSVTGGGTQSFDTTLYLGSLGFGVTYYFRVTASNENGTTVSAIQSFTTPSGPGIRISGNGQTIAVGDNTPDTSDHTDFGSVAVAGGSQSSRDYTITNPGSATLGLTGAPLVGLSGPQAGDFTVSMMPASTIAANGGGTTFTVTFDPSASGTRTAWVTISSNALHTSSHTFAIQGMGAGEAPGTSLAGGDDFNDSTRDAAKWAPADITSGNGSLVEANGRLEYRVATPDLVEGFDEVRREWVLNSAVFPIQAFDVIVDVHNSVEPDADHNASIGITVTSMTNAEDYLTLELFRSGPEGDGKGILAVLRSAAAGGEVMPLTQPTDHPAVTDACLRLTYDPGPGVFTASYDPTGRSDGLQWQEYGTFGISGLPMMTTRQTSWSIPPGGGFKVSVSAFSEGLSISSGQVHADNFQTGTGAAGWRLTTFGTAEATGAAADDADPDGDGMVNFFEYAVGHHGGVAGVLHTPLSKGSGGMLEYFYPRSFRAVSDGIIFDVEWSDSLLPGSWSTEGVVSEWVSTIGGAMQMRALIPTGSSGRRFVRLSVSPPP